MIGRLLPSLVLTLLVVACGRPATTGSVTPFDTLLRTAVDDRRVPNVVAMVATRDGVVYRGAVGVPHDAIFAIASMTKPVTSVAVMQLVEAGRVALDEPAHTYLPELRRVQVLDGGKLRPPKSPPTVRQLLTHTSGFAYDLFNHEIAELVQTGRLVSIRTGTDEFLRAPLVFDPGTQWEYGIGTDWLGRLAERVSGQSLDVYFKTNIFDPLGLSDTVFAVPADKRARLAPLYMRQADGTLQVLPEPSAEAPKFLSGGGGLYSTAADYLRFSRALLAGGELDGRRILRSETVAMMGEHQIGELAVGEIEALDPRLVAPETVLPGGIDGFGLGFALNRRPLVSGRGANTMSWAGVYNTFFWIDRERGIAAVLLSQLLPFGDGGAALVAEDFDRLVYRTF